MGANEIVRAWKSARYRAGLSQEQREALPANPAGAVEIADASLSSAAGGDDSSYSLFTCFTWCVDLTLCGRCQTQPGPTDPIVTP